MPFTQQYNKIIDSEQSISKNLIRPRNVYKITSYEYTDGKTKSLRGNNTAIVFVTGIYEKKLNCLKISLIKPEEFFKWLQKLFVKGMTQETFDSSEKLEDVLILSDKSGSTLFESYIKNKKIGSASESIYRTYNLSGIKQIEEVKIKKNFISQYIKLLKS